jgi:hypothetical protein
VDWFYVLLVIRYVFYNENSKKKKKNSEYVKDKKKKEEMNMLKKKKKIAPNLDGKVNFLSKHFINLAKMPGITCMQGKA